ncbi:MAG: Fe-S cluster assembly protein SufD [Cyanobacteria bacterium J06633_2]
MTIQVSSPNRPAHNDGASPVQETTLSKLLNIRQPLSDCLIQPDIISRLQDSRDRAADEVRSLAFPSRRDEEWRFTDLTSIQSIDFQPPVSGQLSADAQRSIQSFLLEEASGRHCVFVDGQFNSTLSTLDDLPDGVTVTNLSGLGDRPDIAEELATYVAQQKGLEQTFTALNTASFTDVVVIVVDKHVTSRSPVQVLFVSTAGEQPTLTHPRCLIVAKANSDVSIIEDFVAVGSGTYFTNAVTEIWVHDNARVHHTRIQRDRSTAAHIGKTIVNQARSSSYDSHAINLGARIGRHNLEVFQTGEATETILNGLSVVSGDQLVDTHSLINYTKPHGTSRQIYKAIVDGKAHSVFNGKVYVPTTAQLTDAAQLNQNLLLSPKGRVDTKPQLEIVADNVKCTHGATVSQLDSDEVFYLQSRGIDAERAQNLLIYAFAAEIIQQISIPSLQHALFQSIETLTGTSLSS